MSRDDARNGTALMVYASIDFVGGRGMFGSVLYVCMDFG